MNETSPFTPSRKNRSRLSRRNVSQLQQSNDSTLNSPRTPQHTNNGHSSTSQDKFSPKFFSMSQDPSKEIVWEMRPLSPLTQSRNDDFISNLCNSWKTIQKMPSPIGSDPLSKVWKKPHSTPVKHRNHTSLRSKKSRIVEESLDIPASNEMLEIQKIQQLLRSKSQASKADLKSNESKPSVIKDEDSSRRNSANNDASSTIVKRNATVFYESQDIFTEVSDNEVLAPDSCEVEVSEEDLWGDEDESLIRGLSQNEIPELNAAFVGESQLTVPSTLSCDKVGKSNKSNYINAVEKFQPLQELMLNSRKNDKIQPLITVNTPKNLIKTKEVTQRNIERKNVPLIDISVDTELDADEHFLVNTNRLKASKINTPKKKFSDEISFSDDDFTLSQDIISILDQGVVPSTVAKEEPTLSQKRRATADEIARKKEAALKVRQMKIKYNDNKTKKFVRTNSRTWK